METKLLKEKVDALKLLYEQLLKTSSTDVEDIHELRKRTREVLSLVSKEESFYKELKKVIKLTNDIRDIDVFQTLFLSKLPKKLKHKIDLDDLSLSLEKTRQQDISRLLEYLTSLVFPPNVIFEIKQKEQLQDIPFEKFDPDLDQKELHKYRIYIKKLLYNYKNFLPKKKKVIRKLEEIKDHLGYINDNFNALKRLEHLEIEHLNDIKKYIEKENHKSLKKIDKVDLSF